MKEKRAGEIALSIGRHRATKREIKLDPANRNYWESLAGKFEISPDEAQFFFIKVVLPVAVKSSMKGAFGGLHGFENPDEELRGEKIALKILQSETLELSPSRSPEWLIVLSGAINVPVGELKDLYIQYVLPRTIGIIMGWNTCSITGTSDVSK